MILKYIFTRRNEFKAIKLSTDLGINQLECGPFHLLVSTTSGLLYSWGYNSLGVLGNDCYEDQWTPISLNGFDDEKIFMISCGYWHSMALTENGRVFS